MHSCTLQETHTQGKTKIQDNELRTMKSENFIDYWEVLNEHSPNDPHKFVINLEVFKTFFENLNRNPRNNHVTNILN